MNVQFFNHEVENPILKGIIITGAAVFAVALVIAVFALIIPLVAAVLTGVLLVVSVVVLVILIVVPTISVLGLLFSRRYRGNGVERSQTFELEPFDSLSVSGKAQVTVSCGQEQSVTITTDENLMELLEIKVSGKRLSAGFKKHVSTRLGMKLDVTLPELKGFRTAGAANVKLLNVDSPELDVRASGAARLNAEGKSDSFSLRISGTGKVDASKLISKKVAVKISGAGEAQIHADEKLTAKISGAGAVYCSGNPGIVEKHVSGAGKIKLI